MAERIIVGVEETNAHYVVALEGVHAPRQVLYEVFVESNQPLAPMGIAPLVVARPFPAVPVAGGLDEVMRCYGEALGQPPSPDAPQPAGRSDNLPASRAATYLPTV